jgi:ribulose 1,5-bisphosphate synthetase/thiazole synthase
MHPDLMVDQSPNHSAKSVIMEETQVIIVGGGPSGLALGLALSQHGVKVSSPHLDLDTKHFI